jgi:putative membrane protein insertion efficiency factor
VKVVMNTSGGSEMKEGDGLKSVPPAALPCDQYAECGASPATAADTKQSVGVKVALAALRTYKVYLSILFAGNCRFQPTCSMYMYEAIERFGVMRGSRMGLKRLLRCQPLSRKFGYDPVPEKTEVMTGPNRSGASPSNVISREAHS